MSSNSKRDDQGEPDDAIIAHLAEGDLAPAELAKRLGMSLRDLALWARDPQNIGLLSSLAFLADVRAQMLLARYRANAAARLIAIATDDQPSEMSRKACVDLLEANLEVFEHTDEAGPPAPAISEETILAAFERLGEQ